MQTQYKITFDVETTGLNPEKDKIVCLGYKINEEPTKVLFDKIPQELVKIFGSYEYLKIGHNLPFDISFLKKSGVNIVGPYYDTYIAYANKYPFKSHRLKDILKNEMGWKTVELEDICWKEVEVRKVSKRGKVIIRKKKVKINTSEVDRNVLESYNKQDVNGTYELYKLLGDPTEWVENIEFPIIDIVAMMESSGMYLNRRMLLELEEKYCNELGEIRALYPEINLNSSKQLREKLVSLGYSKDMSKYLTDAGEYSTDKLSMKILAKKMPMSKDVLRHREIGKLLSTYIIPYKDRDILRGHFNSVGTKTGRFSSSGPNLQNIPTRTEDGKKIRKCIIPRPEHVFIIGDYSQIEPRLYSHFSGDKKLRDIFINKEDFHTKVTQEIYQKSNPSKEERFVGKTVGLATLYGAQTKKLRETLIKYDVELPFSAVNDIRMSIIKAFPDSWLWSKTFGARTDRLGYIQTIGGRRIYFDKPRNYVNYLIQGSCADIMKVALLNLYNHGFKILSTVHDEVIIECLESSAVEKSEMVKEIMENSFRVTDVPIIADVSLAKSWAEKK